MHRGHHQGSRLVRYLGLRQTPEIQRLNHISAIAKSLVPYRQCSAGKVWLAEDFGASIVDTAICAKPGEVLAGQLLFGDSIPRSYFVLT